ncbi:hypothetical protein CF336_g9578, partial [Tilletia laevis]
MKMGAPPPTWYEPPRYLRTSSFKSVQTAPTCISPSLYKHLQPSFSAFHDRSSSSPCYRRTLPQVRLFFLGPIVAARSTPPSSDDCGCTMPRFVVKKSLFDKLPGEIVLLIMQYVFDRNPKRDQTLKQFIRSTIGVQLLSWKAKLAVDTVIGLHFHAFSRPIHHGVHDCRAPFHPSVH